MGANTFQNLIGGKGMSPEDAYRELVRQAEWEKGHCPYNGTISTTSGFVLVDIGRKRLQKAIDDILKYGGYDINKRRNAGCIELKGKALTEWRRSAGLAGTRARAYVFFGWAAS